MKLIDTSVWVDYLRGEDETELREEVRSLLQSGRAAWCEMIRLELWNGACGAHEIKALKDMESVIPNLSVTPAVWDQAMETARRARKSGRSIPTSDLVIQACSTVHGVELLHNDTHFDLISESSD